jgi:hypothetical protein
LYLRSILNLEKDNRKTPAEAMSRLSEIAIIGSWNSMASGSQEKIRNKPTKKFVELIFFTYSLGCGCDSAVPT